MPSPSLHRRSAARPGASLLAVTLLLAAASSAAAFPFYWASQYASTDCLKLPASSADLSSSPHMAPVRNEQLTFVVRRGARAERTICPGQSYNITMNIPGSGSHEIVTSTHGVFAAPCGGASSSTGKACPNRACNCQGTGSSGCSPNQGSVTYAIKMPCDNNLRGKRNTFAGMYILGSSAFGGALQTNSASMRFRDNCADVATLRGCRR